MVKLTRDEVERSSRLFARYSKYLDGAFALLNFIPDVIANTTAMAAPGLAFNAYQIIRNRCMPNTERAICLVSEGVVDEFLDIASGGKGQIARFFTEQNVCVDFKHKAKRLDLKAALEDEKYQHIAIAGHGDGKCWKAKDGVVSTKDVDLWMQGLPKKRGYFIQCTCGEETDAPLGRSVVECPEKLLGYKEPINFGDRLTFLFTPRMGLETLLAGLK